MSQNFNGSFPAAPPAAASQTGDRIGFAETQSHRDCGGPALGSRPLGDAQEAAQASRRMGRKVAAMVAGLFLLVISAWSCFFYFARRARPKVVPLDYHAPAQLPSPRQ